MVGLWFLLDSAAVPADLVAARTQMALSLGWHIVIACFGVGMPIPFTDLHRLPGDEPEQEGWMSEAPGDAERSWSKAVLRGLHHIQAPTRL
ncbi:MAG: hypothetical protein GEV28_16275 [Actinophytocola sp.]|uniref:hypothetical protein n=1 Tax=Actinophytocola sp. TaxID=1872138 RepID=UPI001325260F|nr:hypothetical protein [Actinophytocola sp.]MPZ81860.1 hypothetical protein [Actinophytocola sp.]